MTSKPLHVRLEVMVDEEESRCADACRYLAREDRQDRTEHRWCTSRIDGRMVRALFHRDGETFRSDACLAATAADERDRAVIEAAENLRHSYPAGAKPVNKLAGLTHALIEAVDALRTAETKERT